MRRKKENENMKARLYRKVSLSKGLREGRHNAF